MKPSTQLPIELEKDYNSIESLFNSINEDWEKHTDELIPEEPWFAKQIIQFIIDVIDYMERYYDTLPLDEWMEFLTSYKYHFYYGPNGDDSNYLDFDEVSVHDIFLTELNDPDKILSKEELERIKNLFIEAKKKF